jgi:hypothetical protein
MKARGLLTVSDDAGEKIYRHAAPVR